MHPDIEKMKSKHSVVYSLCPTMPWAQNLCLNEHNEKTCAIQIIQTGYIENKVDQIQRKG